MAQLNDNIGFIGGGNMAFAIGSGLISCGIIKATNIYVSGPHKENLQRWRDLGTFTTSANYEIVEKTKIVFICVKPNKLELCMDDLRRYSVGQNKIFVSVLAGVTLSVLNEHLRYIDHPKIIRCMPNTPLQVGEGCIVYAPNCSVKQEELNNIQQLFNALGVAQMVPEHLIDAVSGLSGCGPAFVYTIIEALADGAVKIGLPRSMAMQFAAQTILGAAKTVLQTGKHPAILRDDVCSPGGATIAGIHELEKGNIRSILMNAVEKSYQRCIELGRLN